jgi:hypothetical protein
VAQGRVAGGVMHLVAGLQFGSAVTAFMAAGFWSCSATGKAPARATDGRHHLREYQPLLRASRPSWDSAACHGTTMRLPVTAMSTLPLGTGRSASAGRPAGCRHGRLR